MNPTRTSALLMERRQASRAPANRGATIRVAGAEMRCTLLNLSAGGAGLTLERSLDLPPSGLLLIDGEERPRPYRIVWSDANRVGVAFE